MKKVISFSLWGEDPKYCVGALKNAELAKKHYPGWICRYHIGASTPKNYVEELEKFSNCEVILKNELGDWKGSLWRFHDASDLSVDVMLSRDTDSRLNSREAAAVSEWLSGDKKFHIMRDHPYHQTAILGGMWGVRAKFLGDMSYLIDQYIQGDFWQVDQNFLREIIYPIVKKNSMVHDEFFEKNPFPTKRKENFFVGQAFNADDSLFEPEHSEMVI